jgi:hypothetical protein
LTSALITPTLDYFAAAGAKSCGGGPAERPSAPQETLQWLCHQWRITTKNEVLQKNFGLKAPKLTHAHQKTYSRSSNNRGGWHEKSHIK